MSTDTLSPGEPAPTTAWEDTVFSEPDPPPDYTPAPSSFDDTPPPQLVRTVNLLPIPEHGLRGPEDIDAIAEQILNRTREGVADIFAHEDYAGYEDEPTEAWARAIAEHQTGIPYTMPSYFYGSQKSVAAAIAGQGRYPLMGQCQQSATTALCLGGWDGGKFGDIGSGKDSQPYCASLGQGFRDVPSDLKKWSDELWSDVKVGSCLFWSTDSPGVGHVVVVIRKHPSDRKWQIWDTGTSFYDPTTHVAVAKQARMLWESHWWDYIPPVISTTWKFQGIGLINGLGRARQGLRPRGRARLLLSRRSDKKLLFRSEWIDMEANGLPISWLLRGLRGAPFADQIEATFCVNSPPNQVKSFPKGLPILDCSVDAKGNAHMAWSWQWKQGYHERKNAAIWQPDAPYRGGAEDPEHESTSSPPPAVPAPPAAFAQAPAAVARLRAPPQPDAEPTLASELLRGVDEIERVARGDGALRQGAKGAGVKALQQALIALGLEVPGGADGAFGKGTTIAVKKVQEEAGLSADGVAGASTIKAIDARLSRASSSS